MGKRLDAILFDLDGTLADTLAAITTSSNHVLGALGLPAITEARSRQLVGHGARYFLTHALGPEHEHQVDQALAAYLAYYAEHALARTTAFPGVVDLLDALARRGLPMAVLTNKPHDAAAAAIEHLFGPDRFVAVVGQREGQPAKPDPALALDLARQLNVEPARCAYVGDMTIDIETGRNAGMVAVAVRWGFGDLDDLPDHQPDAIIDRPAQLLDLIDAEAACQQGSRTP